MSHHFDTPTGREDPRLNLCDFYLFPGRPGSTVMAMTVNPEADAAGGPLFRDDEGLYAFRFDLDGDGREEVTFKVRFGTATHTGTGAHQQTVEVRRATGGAADHGVDGDLVCQGATDEVVAATDGVMAFAGQVADPFAGNAAGLEEFGAALARGEFKPDAFGNRENFFAPRSVAAIVLEVPDELIGTGQVQAWATVSLYGHAPEQQVARWGLPLITHLFLGDEEVRESFNRTPPAGDNQPFLAHIAAVVQAGTTSAGTAPDPAAYAQRVVDRFGLLTLPYTVGSPASFDFVGFNGRAPGDDVMDVMLSLMTNSALGDGAVPDPGRIKEEFPYFTAAAG